MGWEKKSRVGYFTIITGKRTTSIHNETFWREDRNKERQETPRRKDSFGRRKLKNTTERSRGWKSTTARKGISGHEGGGCKLQMKLYWRKWVNTPNFLSGRSRTKRSWKQKKIEKEPHTFFSVPLLPFLLPIPPSTSHLLTVYFPTLHLYFHQLLLIWSHKKHVIGGLVFIVYYGTIVFLIYSIVLHIEYDWTLLALCANMLSASFSADHIQHMWLNLTKTDKG